jgi:cytochrome c oxidase cbb3-type subunit II
MKMTPALLVIGGLVVFWASTFIAVILPAMTLHDEPAAADAWRPWTADEEAGHRLYVSNGCSYCHSQYVRAVDWELGAERLAQPQDYYTYNPAILGTERTGPDLSQEGGEHPDDWQLAHFMNPRTTRPMSLMPSWEFMGRQDIGRLTAYVQSLGGKDADFRTDRQTTWKKPALAAYEAGADKNVEWLHANVPQVWRDMPNPYPATTADLARGKRVYQEFCINCHGPMGDGQGAAAAYMTPPQGGPPPLNFTTVRRHLAGGKYIGGIFYYQIMNGITGTGMPYFKRELESEKIWEVSNYVAVSFVGYTDATLEPRGIPAAYEPAWTNTFQAPAPTGTAAIPSTVAVTGSAADTATAAPARPRRPRP